VEVDASPAPVPTPEILLPALPLPPGRVMLEYFIGDEQLYGWRLGREVRFVALGPAPPVLAAAGEVHRALSRGEVPPADDLRLLSAALLRPLLAAPPGDDEGPLEELFVAADGRLRYLPFELLEDPAAAGQPLIERASVAYLPSVSVAARPSRGESGSWTTLVALGDPLLPETGDRLAPSALWIDRFALERLPAARREVDAIAAQIGGSQRLLVGVDASEAALRRTLARGSRVVHLATHTVVDERPGRGAAILLASGEGEDGVLSPREIAALSWRADLTVLASCRSALGTAEGSALGSLTGALLAAGSSGVIASLWDVDDEATAVFMEQLYHRLGRGRSPAQALREVKRALRSQGGWDRPEVWSAFVLIGDAPAVGAPGGFGYEVLFVLLAAVVLLAVALSFLPRSRRRKGRPGDGPPSPTA
jgi:hypothetical protein